MSEVQALLDQGSNATKVEDALHLFQAAQTKARTLKDDAGEAEALNGCASVYAIMRQPAKELECYRLAVKLYKQIGNQRQAASFLYNMGSLYQNLGQPRGAMQAFQEALALSRANGYSQVAAYTLNGMGLVYADQGQLENAVQCYQQALPLYTKIGANTGEPITLANLANAYDHLGQPQEALQCYRHALELYRAAGDSNGEAKTINGIGIVYSQIGQPQTALQNFHRVLMLAKQIGDLSIAAAPLTNIGDVYANLGRPQEALQNYKEALELHRKAGDSAGEAYALNGIGGVYVRMRQAKSALEYQLQARKLYRQIHNMIGEAEASTNIGVSYYMLGRSKEALQQYRQALQLHKKLGNVSGQAHTFLDIGLAYWRSDPSHDAQPSFQQASLLYRQAGDKQGASEALAMIALLQANQGRFAAAEQSYQAAVDLLESVRENLSDLAAAKTDFLASHLATYATYLAFLLHHNQTERAFALAQKTKARTLLDLLAGGKVTITAALTPEEEHQEQQLQHQANELNARLLRDGGKDPMLKQRTAQAERHLQTWVETLYARHPDLARKRIAHTLTLQEAGQVLPPDTALLEFITLKSDIDRNVLDTTVLFVITRERQQTVLKVYSIPIKGDILAQKSEGLRLACAGQPGTPQQQPYESRSRELYRLLIAPAERQLAGKRRLIICPDGPLWDVPFQALLVPAPDGGNATVPSRFLLERYELAYAYSATGMKAALDARKQQNRPQPGRTLLALANPDFGDLTLHAGASRHAARDHEVKAVADMGVAAQADAAAPAAQPPPDTPLMPRGGLTPLPATQQEADALQKIFSDANIQTGKAALKSLVQQEGGRYRYLHLATHGFYNDAAPLLSCIALAQSSPGDTESVFLTAREIFDMTLSAELVVLSACETGRGEKRSGEGIMGLTWALFVAGAPAQVVSQWNVNDVGTATLMEAFYAGLKRGQPKETALRAAALSLLNGSDPHYRHPYYWAPFFLMGDWR
jgi:CHAT domain-containing protein/tetratricopeptide (TPR) repeat protein